MRHSSFYGRGALLRIIENMENQQEEDKMSKLLFFDLDGTLVNFDSTILPAAIDAIHKAQANGHKVFVCTGRSYCQMTKEITDIGFDGYVTATGAHILCDDKVIFNHHMEKDSLKWIDHYMKEYEAIPIYQAGASLLISEEKYQSMLDLFRQDDMDERRLNDFIGWFETYKEPFQDFDRIEKMIYFSCKAPFKQVKADLPKGLLLTGSSFTEDDQADSAEITTAEITKSFGIKKVLEYYGLNQKDTIAFGDGPNDLDMLEYANIGVAMGNARADLKEKADYVTDCIDQNGIAKALQHLGLV